MKLYERTLLNNRFAAQLKQAKQSETDKSKIELANINEVELLGKLYIWLDFTKIPILQMRKDFKDTFKPYKDRNPFAKKDLVNGISAPFRGFGYLIISSFFLLL